MNVLNLLNNAPREKKQKLIHSWVSVMPPFLGSLKTLQIHLSADNDFMFYKNYFGLHVKAAVESINNILSTYEMSPKDPFQLYKGQKWFEAVEKRMRYEEQDIDYKDSGFAFLPKKEENCSPKNFVHFPQNCTLGFWNMTANDAVKILDQSYKLNELPTMLQTWNLTEKAYDLIRYTEDRKFDKLINPEVPIFVVTLRTMESHQFLEYPFNIT